MPNAPPYADRIAWGTQRTLDLLCLHWAMFSWYVLGIRISWRMPEGEIVFAIGILDPMKTRLATGRLIETIVSIPQSLHGAGDGTRTREYKLGKLVPYHLATPAHYFDQAFHS